MAQPHTDREYVISSHLAYADMINDNWEVLNSQWQPDGKVPLDRLLYEDTEKEYSEDLGTAREHGLTDEQLHSWKVVKVVDHNDTTGFSAVIIETEPGKAIVAFRGSESMFNDLQSEFDWSEADIALLDEIQTKQQAEVVQFLANNKDLLKEYDISFTGHSLGGNLAEYATVMSVRFGLDGNVSQCVSLDSPGFNDEFHEQYASEIEMVRSKMKHYEWSFVGKIFRSPASETINADIQIGARLKFITRHSMQYLNYDGASIRKRTWAFDADGDIMDWISEWLGSLPLLERSWITDTIKDLFKAFVFVGAFVGFIGGKIGDVWDEFKTGIIHLFGGETDEDILQDIAENAHTQAMRIDAFQIDPVMFLDLGVIAGKAAECVKEAANYFISAQRYISKRLYILYHLDSNIMGVADPAIKDDRVSRMEAKFKKLGAALDESLKYANYCETTLEGVRSYFLETGIEFAAVEDDAVKRINDWYRVR